jgi:signal transduction histidine kinase
VKRPRPSLIRRITVGFVLSIGIAILLFELALYPIALIEEDEPIGPEVLITYVEGDLALSRQGRPQLRRDPDVARFSAAHPGAWFIARAGNEVLSFGPVPRELRDRQRRLPGPAYMARYHDLGTTGPRGEAFTGQVQVGGRNLVVTAGGVDSRSISFREYLRYTWANHFFWMPVGIAFFNLAGALIAIPIILRSLRPTALAAAELDPADLSKRLPEARVVKELRPIVRAFNAALDRLAEGFERRKRFIADTAHELRTPLAILNMHVEVLPDSGGKSNLQRIVYRLGQMVGQMLDAERLVLGGRQRELVDLVGLARAAIADVAPLAVANGYELAFSAEAEKVVVEGDPHALSRAITNLLGNALAHGGGSGIVEVRVHADGRLDVSDQGAGVPEEARERIFEPFHRERWDRDGCGLGLHLVREIMQAHGGQARLLSSGPGAVFRLEFPEVQPA